MKDEDLKPRLMKLLGISDEKIADKVLKYANLINDGTTTNLVNTDKKKNAQKLIDNLKANDFALAKVLNQYAYSIADLVALAYRNLTPGVIEIDKTLLNKCYILLTNELSKIYKRSRELSNIKSSPIWHNYEFIIGNEFEIKEDIYSNSSYACNDHIKHVEKLCIISDIEQPQVVPAKIQKLIEDTEKAILDYKSKLDQEMQNKQKDEIRWFIPKYTLRYSEEGSIIINDVLVLKKTQSGSAPRKVMEQALNQPNVLFKPSLDGNAKYTRRLTSVLSDMGIKGAIRKLFFPIVSESNGIKFRPTVSRAVADSEKIDTTVLDKQLIKLNAHTELDPDTILF